MNIFKNIKIILLLFTILSLQTYCQLFDKVEESKEQKGDDKPITEDDNKEVKSLKYLENNVIEISLNSFITYILDPKNSKIMIFNTTN